MPVGVEPLTDADWRLAEALAVLNAHGDHAPAFVAERLGALALAGDKAGISRWQDIAAAMVEHLRATRQ